MELKVEGMSCGGCVSSVKRILIKQLEIEEGAVDVSLDGGSAQIPDDVDAAKVQVALEKLEKAGFPARQA